jgi:hypothetical protein
MRNNRLILLIAATILIAAVSLSVSYAQEATPEAEPGDMVTCDADLILTLYAAERFFDFSSFAGQLSPDMTVNIDDFDKGQFEPLFDRAEGMAGTDALDMSDQMRSHMSDMMAMSDDEFDEHIETGMMPGAAEAAGTDVSALSMLQTGDVADEADECAALRSALRRFFVGLVFADAAFDGLGTGVEGAAGETPAGAEATEEAETGAVPGAITVNLTGAEEAPGPGDEDATGTAVVYLRGDSNEVCVDLAVQNTTLPTSAAHIHRGAAGEAGPPVVPLTAPDATGLSSTCVTVEAELMQELINDPQNFYVNVHTDDFPDGAVRGQLP